MCPFLHSAFQGRSGRVGADPARHAQRRRAGRGARCRGTSLAASWRQGSNWRNAGQRCHITAVWVSFRGGAPSVDDLRCFPPVQFASEPIPHCMHSGGGRSRSAMPWDGVGSMIGPRLKLEIHRAEMSHHSSLGSGRGGAPSVDDLRCFPPVRFASEPIQHCTHAAASWSRSAMPRDGVAA